MSTVTEAPKKRGKRAAKADAKTVGTRKRRLNGADTWWGWAFVIPTMAGVLLFYIWPLLKTGYYSFTEWGAFGRSVEWTGLDNYQRMFADPIVWKSIGNTLLYTVIVLAGIPLAVFFASLINRPGLKFAAVYRVAFFMPYVAMPTAVALVWKMIFAGDFGIFNYFLSIFGIKGPAWIATPGFAIVAVGVVGLWASFGFIMIILSAGLKSIPPELYEAASLDGASNMRQFWSITVPLLTPSIFFVTVITVINGMQLFDLLFVMMGGKANPAMNDSQSIVYFFYNNGFILNDRGYASAVAMLILVIIGAVTAVQFKMQNKWVNYE